MSRESDCNIVKAKRWLRPLFWEFVQNLPLAAAFVYGSSAWKAGHSAASAAIITAGVLVGTLLIRFTEPRIEQDEIEKASVTAANFFFFLFAVLGFTLYFSLDFGGALTDLALGLLAGAGASAMQSRAAGGPMSARHTLALTISFTLALFAIRLFILDLDPFLGTMVLTGLVTPVIVAIDYAPKPERP